MCMLLFVRGKEERKTEREYDTTQALTLSADFFFAQVAELLNRNVVLR